MTEQNTDIKIPPQDNDQKIPSELPILPLRDTVAFPNIVTPLVIARDKSVRLVNDVLAGNRIVGLVAQRDSNLEEPAKDDIYSFGTAASILRMLKFPDGSIRVLMQGVSRIKLLGTLESDPYLKCKVKVIPDTYKETTELEAIKRNITSQFQKIVTQVPQLPDELQVVSMNTEHPGKLADLVASNLNLSLEEKQEIIELVDIRKRLERLMVYVNREVEVIEMGSKIQNEVQSELGKNQREYFLREQLRAIQKELGMGDERNNEIEELRTKIKETGMSEDAEKEALRELDRLAKMQPGAAEYTVSRTYIDWMITLPWSVYTEDNLDRG